MERDGPSRTAGMRGVGPAHGPWRLLLLLAVAVAVPTVCVLWFMTQAVRNTRLAVRQKLAEAYERPFQEAVVAVGAYWQERANALADTAPDADAPERFAALDNEHPLLPSGKAVARFRPCHIWS